MVVDELARRHGGSWRGKFAGQMAEVRVGDHQFHPAQAAGIERTQERGPERAVLVLAVPDAQTEDFAVAVEEGATIVRVGTKLYL